MKSMKAALENGWSNDRPQTLQTQLDATGGVRDDRNLHRLTLRLPKAAVRELHDLARSRGISVNELAATFIDEGLIREGRSSIAETAPWFASYLRRSEVDPKPSDEGSIFG
jgi:hypothetical protein